MRSVLPIIPLMLAWSAAAAAEGAPPVDEAVFAIQRRGKAQGEETMVVHERTPQRARYASAIMYGKKTAYRGELVTGPAGAVTSYKVEGSIDGSRVSLDSFAVDNAMEFRLTRDGTEKRFKVVIPLLCMALDGEMASHWQALVDGLDGPGPWKRNTIAPFVVKLLPVSVTRKKTGAVVLRKGKAHPLDLLEVVGVKTARIYATKEGAVVLVEVPTDGYVMKRKGWTVKR